MWYRTGTVAVTNGSPAVTGTGTDFVSNSQVGYAFLGADGRSYEVAAIVSATQLTLATSYLGATGAAQAYAIQPTSSLAGDLAAAVGVLINTFAAVRDGVGQGLIPDGTVAAPALRFSADQDTGIYLNASNAVGIAVGGTQGAFFEQARTRLGGTADFLDVNFGSTGVTCATAAPTINYNAQGGNGHAWYVGGTPRAALVSTAFYPYVDNSCALGGPSTRWTTVYAAAGTINTSDEREKTWRGALTSNELAAAKEIAGSIGIFQFNAARAAKGIANARLHTGVKAQATVAIMTAHGLDPMRYGFVCHDVWGATAAVPAHDGLAAIPAVAAGDRYGIRYDELAMFLLAAQEQRLAALEAA